MVPSDLDLESSVVVLGEGDLVSQMLAGYLLFSDWVHPEETARCTACIWKGEACIQWECNGVCDMCCKHRVKCVTI